MNLKKLQTNITDNLLKIGVFNFGLIALETLYISLRFEYLNNEIPFWHTLPWGDYQLTTKANIFLLPLTSIAITLVGLTFILFTKEKFMRYGEELIFAFITLCNLLLGYSLLRIVMIASSPFNPLINPELLKLAPPALFAFFIVYLITPKALDELKERGIITDPQQHNHPGMLLTKPSARGGGLIFTIGFVLTTILFVKFNAIVWGLIIAMIAGALLGLADDIQNTKPIKQLRFVEKPINRFWLQALLILPILFAGALITSINNPFNGMLTFDTWKIVIGGIELMPLALGITLLWMLWIMNVLSWSNGVDGQYGGVIGIAAIVIAIITLREEALFIEHQNMLRIAAITAGASLGLLRYTWNPSKIMWGFGAISAGIVLALLSILTKAKVATGLMVLAVPFLDGMITVTRRLLQRKSPLSHDRGHLHHILLDRGWSVRQVAVFYWASTIITGYIGISSADKDPMLTALIMGGFIAFGIILLNIRTFRHKSNS